MSGRGLLFRTRLRLACDPDIGKIVGYAAAVLKLEQKAGLAPPCGGPARGGNPGFRTRSRPRLAAGGRVESWPEQLKSDNAP